MPGWKAAERVTVTLGALLVIAFVAHAVSWAFLCDDAFISFRYADNLVRHGALDYNVAGLETPERVEGYSNFLWVLVLALGLAAGALPEQLAPVLTVLASLAGLVVIVSLTRSLRRLPGAAIDPWSPLDLAPAALLAASAEYSVWSQGGLETALAAALVLGSMLAWTRGGIRAAAVLAALAGLTRLDSLVPIGLFGIAWLAVIGLPALRRAGRPAIPWRRVLVAASLFALLLVAQLLFRRAHYGQWLPNTWAVKAHGALLRDPWGVEYVRAWADQLGLVYAAPLALLLRPRHLVYALPLVGVVVYAWSVGGDFMAYGRFLVVATALAAGLFCWLVRDACDWLGTRVADWDVPASFGSSRIAPAACAAVLLLATALTARHTRVRWQYDRGRHAGWIDGRWEGTAAMDRFARERLHVGRWMRDNLPPDTLVTVGAAGALAYTSRLPVLDTYGLVDPVIARDPKVRPMAGPRVRPGHQLRAPRSYIDARDPDLICHVGVVGERRPGPRDAARRGYRGYAWACVEPGPVPDAREPDGTLDLGYYCCLRPKGRAVGPFQ